MVTIVDDDERAVVPDPRSLTLVEAGPSQTFTVTYWAHSPPDR